MTNPLHTRLRKTAQRLIKSHGRSVTFRGDGLDSLSLNAVFVAPGGSVDGLSAFGTGTQFNDLVSRSQEVAMVEHREGMSIVDYTILDDPDGPLGGSWYISGIQALRPGGETILYYIGLRL